MSDGASSFKRAGKDLVNPFFLVSFVFYLIRSPTTKRFLLGCFGKNRKYRTLYKKMYLVKRRLYTPSRTSS